MVPLLNSYGSSSRSHRKDAVSPTHQSSNALPLLSMQNTTKGPDVRTIPPTPTTTSFAEGSTSIGSSGGGPSLLMDKPSSSKQATSSKATTTSATASPARYTPRYKPKPVPKQNSLPQAIFRRQAAIDAPSVPGGRGSVSGGLTHPAIVLSANNSVDSAGTTGTSPSSPAAGSSSLLSTSQQRLRQEKFHKSRSCHQQQQQNPSNSITSSLHSNGDLRKSTNFLNRSGKSSLYDLRESARRKFSIIPQVSGGCDVVIHAVMVPFYSMTQCSFSLEIG